MTPFPRAAFKALLASLLNLPPAYVNWRGEKEPAFNFPGGQFLWGSLRLGPSSRTTVGWDELRRSDGPNGTMTVLQNGRRKIVLSMDLFTYASTDLVMADDLLDGLVARIYEPGTLALVNTMALVVETNGPIVPLPTTINARYISAAHVDLTVALAVQSTSPTYPGGNNTIGEVLGTGTVTTEGGGTTSPTYDVHENVHP